jgi:uncharacterized protein YkwD
VLTLVFLITGLAAPLPAAASTTISSVASTLLRLTNAARSSRGLQPLRADATLASIARNRAANLSADRTFSHSAAGGTLTPTLDQAGVQWYAWAEDLAYTAGGLQSSTASAIFAAWKMSPAHWAALMSRTLNYVGLGVAVRPSDGRVFADAVFTESRDRTAPSARIDSATRSGRTIAFTWHGYDPPLQTHRAGLRDFDAWYRVDGGAWKLIRDNTTATGIRLASRPSGHRYWLMVRARDRAGNVGRTSPPASIWVP